MNKIYLGETEVANVGSGGSGGGDYVLNSSFNEMAKVAASALVNLKGLESKIEKFDESIHAQEDALLAEVHVVEQSKADVSTVYTKSDIDKSDKVVAAALASINERVSSIETSIGSGSGGGSGTPVDLSGYVTYENLNASIGDFTYNKSHIDSSYGVIDASLKYLDASALAFDASIKELASRPSGGGGGSNISKLSDLTNDCDFRPITYITKDDYDDLVEAETLDADTMYVITDLADTDDLATLVSIQDLSTAKAQINASLSSTANTIITEANTSINYWRTTYVTNANSSINSIKNTAISAVQSQQTTSVNAVNTAKTNANSSINSAKESALSDISTFSADKIASMPTFVVMTESDYQQITPNSSTIYFLT